MGRAKKAKRQLAKSLGLGLSSADPAERESAALALARLNTAADYPEFLAKGAAARQPGTPAAPDATIAREMLYDADPQAREQAWRYLHPPGTHGEES